MCASREGGYRLSEQAQAPGNKWGDVGLPGPKPGSPPDRGAPYRRALAKKKPKKQALKMRPEDMKKRRIKMQVGARDKWGFASRLAALKINQKRRPRNI